MDDLEKFVSVVRDSVGNISSRRFRKDYFLKHDKEHIWNWFESKKELFSGYTDKDVIFLLQNGFNEPPKCIVCGNNSKVQAYNGKARFSVDYCSKECSYISVKRKQQISKTKQSHTTEQKEKIEERRRSTNLDKYGFEYQAQREEVKEIVSKKATDRYLTVDVFTKLSDYHWLDVEYNIKKRSAVDIADELEIYYGTVISYCQKHGFKIRRVSKGSLPQKQIYEYIKSIYDGEVHFDYWDLLGNREIDIYIPEFKLCIEHNGLPSHSSDKNCIKNKSRHLYKTIECEKLGMTLFHIRGDQWIKQKEIVKSMIASKMGMTSRVYARKCIIKEITTKEARDFFDKTHIQGYTDSSIKLGLFYNDELVASGIFSKPRYNKNYDWELIRFSNQLNTTVVGGMSKLLKHFRMSNSGSIISYCDRGRGSGKSYQKIGFTCIGQTEPGYYWTDNHKVYHRSNFQKHKLKEKLKSFDENLTELENMFNNGYRIYYDCGQLVFVIN